MTKSNHSDLYCKKLPSGIPKHHQWVLGLTLVEKDSITNGEWLSDRIIDVGQKLLKQKFPHVAGPQCTCMSGTKASVCSPDNRIHPDPT